MAGGWPLRFNRHHFKPPPACSFLLLLTVLLVEWPRRGRRPGGPQGWGVVVAYLLAPWFVDLGTVDHSFGTGLVPVIGSTTTSLVTGSTAFSSSIHVYENMIRLGLNYKF
jgi:hypothetical protein